MDAQRARGLVVGTAGHIDHGKTSLVRALTGIDTDRLAEEKKRGISIDLGFAHLTLEDGAEVSFVDVPGHERFIKNMLAGAAGIEAVMLIVAADESVKPQTREHFEICRLLGIRAGFVVLTKCDLASDAQIQQARADIALLCDGSFLEMAPVIQASAAAWTGLDAIRTELRNLASVPPARAAGIARLPVDRSFSMKGFGTVVTGTLSGGTLLAGGTVFVHPGGREVRVRGLQVHGVAVNEAAAGQRTAVNLANIEHTEIGRGDVLTNSPILEASGRVAVEFEILPPFEIPARRHPVLLHIGAAEIPAKLKAIEQNGSQYIGMLGLTRRALALAGDRFILRRPSPGVTIGGGVVIDPFPRTRVKRVKAVERLKRLRRASAAERIELLTTESVAGLSVRELIKQVGCAEAEVMEAVRGSGTLFVHTGSQRVFAKRWLEERRTRLVTWLSEFHAKNPSKAGAPIAVARLGLAPELAAIVFENFPALRVSGDTVALVAHRIRFNPAEVSALQQIETAFLNGGFAPPAVADVMRAAMPDAKKARGLLELLIKTQRLVRVSDDLVFHADVVTHIRTSLAAHKGRRFSVPEFKEWTQISRKYAIPLLEYLDHERVTKRDGDVRVVL